MKATDVAVLAVGAAVLGLVLYQMRKKGGTLTSGGQTTQEQKRIASGLTPDGANPYGPGGLYAGGVVGDWGYF